MATSDRNVDLKKINQEADLIWTLMPLWNYIQFTKFINIMQQKSNLIWGIDKA